MLPGLIKPVYSERMTAGLSYLVNWYCLNQEDGLAASAMDILDMGQRDLLDADPEMLNNCTR